jgi:hypothetical protein
MALDAGVAERQVRGAQAQGKLLAGVITAIRGDLLLDEDEQANAPGIVRRHLLAWRGDSLRAGHPASSVSCSCR